MVQFLLDIGNHGQGGMVNTTSMTRDGNALVLVESTEQQQADVLHLNISRCNIYISNKRLDAEPRLGGDNF